MLGKVRILVVLAIFCPNVVFGADSSVVEAQENTEERAEGNYEINIAELTKLRTILADLHWGDDNANEEKKELYQKLENLISSIDEKNKTILSQKKQAYEDAKTNEQSLENRTLTAVTTAATGIGGMELAMGLSQQNADKAAEQSMDAYIATFRCTYGDGKSVKGGPDEIQLPSGNTDELMKLRSEYKALAADLKQRKEALGLKPGIEAEEILDKTQMGLYDDEFVGITSGAYESLYRAKMLGSEADQAKLDEQAKSAKNRVIAGATVAGAGLVAGIAGNLALNKKNDAVDDGKKIIQDRESLLAELNDSLFFEIDKCNQIIQDNKKYVEKLKKNPALANDKWIAGYIQSIEELTPLENIDDLSKLKDHPLCK